VFMTRAVLTLLAAVALAACDTGAVPEPKAVDARHLYVTNQGEASVSVLDVTTGALVRKVDLTLRGFTANASPHFARFNEDATAWYLTLIGDGKVVRFDADDRVTGTVSTATPGMLSEGPAGELVVSRSLSAVNPPAALAFVDPATMTLREERAVGHPHPHGLAYADRFVYTASLRDNVVIRFDRNGAATEVTVPGPAQGLAHLATSPDHRRLAVSADLTGQVHLFTIGADGTFRYDGAVAVGSRPWHLHFGADSRTLYVPLYGEDALAIVDAEARTVTGRLSGPGFAQPYMTLLSRDGRTLYVSNANRNCLYTGAAPGAGTIVFVDTGTHTVRRVVEVGRYPTGLALPGTHH
jgi:YVTN family beta-propeller protein